MLADFLQTLDDLKKTLVRVRDLQTSMLTLRPQPYLEYPLVTSEFRTCRNWGPLRVYGILYLIIVMLGFQIRHHPYEYFKLINFSIRSNGKAYLYIFDMYSPYLLHIP